MKTLQPPGWALPRGYSNGVAVQAQGALVEIALDIETTDAAAPAKLEQALTAAFSLRIPARRVADLPRFELKAQRWIRS